MHDVELNCSEFNNKLLDQVSGARATLSNVEMYEHIHFDLKKREKYNPGFVLFE